MRASVGQRTIRFDGVAGTRPRQPADQRYDNTTPICSGAICQPAASRRSPPYAYADVMQLHLDEISRSTGKDAHAVLLIDRFGRCWAGKLDVHGSITRLPPFRAPELNLAENSCSLCARNWLCPRKRRLSGQHASLGESSSPNSKRSPPSECATGLTSVSLLTPVLLLAPARRA